jgi:hypothetical protein
VKHAGADALHALEPLLGELRRREPLREKSRGTFYLKSKAFLHFHEDPQGLFADVRADGDWSRVPVDTLRQREALLRKVDRALKKLAARPPGAARAPGGTRRIVEGKG